MVRIDLLKSPISFILTCDYREDRHVKIVPSIFIFIFSRIAKNVQAFLFPVVGIFNWLIDRSICLFIYSFIHISYFLFILLVFSFFLFFIIIRHQSRAGKWYRHRFIFVINSNLSNVFEFWFCNRKIKAYYNKRFNTKFIGDFELQEC